ncbi:MAG: TldD/PmbA family protein [Bdellovibrionales bacterium]|nr:TldD/PmbA family protein [Bdellovibrionales bacterium]
MLQKRQVDSILDILKRDSKRVLKMRVPAFPNPYFCSFLLRDVKWFNTWASSGSTYRRRSDHTRNVYCDIRVGSYRYDQVTEGGLFDNDDERDSYNHVTVPIDDTDYSGLRHALWRLSESKFREACSDYSDRRASGLSTIDSNKKYQSFTKGKAVRSIKYGRPERIDEDRWVRFCKRISKFISKLKQVSGNFVEFDASQSTSMFVSTEGSVVVQHQKVFSLVIHMRKLTKEGSQVEQELVLNCGTLKDLPDIKQLKKRIMEKYYQLLDLIAAKKLHSFSGPILLCPQPAGLLFHEAIGHRLEGSRLLSSGEGQTFKGHIGKRVIKSDLTVRDNPQLKTFRGKRCIGAYDYDDEGVEAQDALLIERGVLKGFLTTRAAISKTGHSSNGHARNRKYQRPISRMGVTIIESDSELTFDDLREKLLEEIHAQNKPFGMIVYESNGGETETASYDFQAFAGQISYATIVYPDGKEEPVKGVDFVGTPLQALGNIIAVGRESEIDNSYCGAESGFVPVTTISPAILLSNLELQAKDEELYTPNILPKPRT